MRSGSLIGCLLPLIAALSLSGCGGGSGSSGAATSDIATASDAPVGGSGSASGTITRADNTAAAATTTDAVATPAPEVAPVTLSWTQPAKNTNGSVAADLEGYYIYYGASAESLNRVVTVEGAGTTRYTIANLSAGTWYFAITAYNNSRVESELSAVVPVAI